METLKQILAKDYSQLIEQFQSAGMVVIDVDEGDYVGVHLRTVNVIQCLQNKGKDSVVSNSYLMHDGIMFILARYEAIKDHSVTWKIGLTYSTYRRDLAEHYAKAYRIGKVEECESFFKDGDIVPNPRYLSNHTTYLAGLRRLPKSGISFEVERGVLCKGLKYNYRELWLMYKNGYLKEGIQSAVKKGLREVSSTYPSTDNLINTKYGYCIQMGDGFMPYVNMACGELLGTSFAVSSSGAGLRDIVKIVERTMLKVVNFEYDGIVLESNVLFMTNALRIAAMEIGYTLVVKNVKPVTRRNWKYSLDTKNLISIHVSIVKDETKK